MPAVEFKNLSNPLDGPMQGRLIHSNVFPGFRVDVGLCWNVSNSSLKHHFWAQQTLAAGKLSTQNDMSEVMLTDGSLNGGERYPREDSLLVMWSSQLI